MSHSLSFFLLFLFLMSAELLVYVNDEPYCASTQTHSHKQTNKHESNKQIIALSVLFDETRLNSCYVLTRWRFSLTFSLAFAHSLSCTFTAFDLLWTHQHTHARTISNVTQTITRRHRPHKHYDAVSMYLYVNVFCGRNFCYLYVFYKFCAMFFVCRFSSSYFFFLSNYYFFFFFSVWNTFGLFTSSCVILFSCFIKCLFQLGFVNQPLLGANCETAFFWQIATLWQRKLKQTNLCTHSHTRHRVENQLDFFFLLISSWTIERT